MSDFVKILTHIRRLNKAVKELDVEQLEAVKGKIDAVIDIRRREMEAEAARNAEKQAEIERIKEMMAQCEISVDDIAGRKRGKGKRPPREPRYEIYNDAGERITWTGQGRKPNIFKDQLAMGKTMEDFLIRK